jgi:hypothetical protein
MTTNAVANFANRPAGAGGRPLGARTRLSHKLVEDLSDLWHANGPQILKMMASREPARFAMMAYATLPKDVLVSVEQRIPGGLSAEDWVLLTQVLDLIRNVLPPGSNSPPAEVFSVIETALRSHFANRLDSTGPLHPVGPPGGRPSGP